MPAGKAELRAWCRERYGPDWHADDKTARLAEAATALAAAEASAQGGASIEQAATNKEPSSSSISASDLRAWCRQKYGNEWHTADKAARLDEARSALCVERAAAPASSKQASGSTKRSASESAAGKLQQPATRAAVAAKEPKHRIEELLTQNNAKTYMALMQIQRYWNVLDFSGEQRISMEGEELKMVPVYYDDHERCEMLTLMSEVIRGGASSYENPYGADDTEALLEAFAELPAGEQRKLHDVAKMCVKKGTTIDDEALAVVLALGAE